MTALLKNGSNQPVKGTLKGKIENVEFSQDVELGANESKDVVFDPAKFSQLNFDKPRLWWPVQMGTPNLYDLSVSFEGEPEKFRFQANEVRHPRNEF